MKIDLALSNARKAAEETCSGRNIKGEPCEVGKSVALNALDRDASTAKTKEQLQRALDTADAESDVVCMQYGKDDYRSCKMGKLAALGAFRNTIAKTERVELMGVRPPQLGLFVSPGEPCPEGFERVKGIKGGKNKNIHLCRLADGYRKYSPEQRPKGKPLRRKREFGPGVEPDKILPWQKYKTRKSSRRLLDT